MPKSKPSDIVFASISWDELNKKVIQAIGVIQIVSGILLLAGKNGLAALCMIVYAAFMMATKDNIKMKSDVAAITREEKDRPENICRDISLIGCALILLGGMASNALSDFKLVEEAVVQPQEEDKKKK